MRTRPMDMTALPQRLIRRRAGLPFAGALLALQLAACAAPPVGAPLDCPDLDAPPGAPPYVGERPPSLVQALAPGSLRERLSACLAGPARPGSRTIGHRGAPLRYPEHTRESYLAAARLGATTLECDVTFTQDRALVCRHDACDLHRTTNILQTPLAARCSEPFRPARFEAGVRVAPAAARCCTTDLDLEAFLSLKGRRDAVDEDARSVDEYLAAAPQETACRQSGTLMTHRDSIALFQDLGVDMAPELKALPEPMPFDDLRLQDLADQLVAEYEAAGVAPERVWLQTFDPDVVRHWLVNAPAFADRVVWLDGRYTVAGFDHRDMARRAPEFLFFRGLGLRTLAPPFWMLVEAGQGGLEPSLYARAAQESGLELMTWTMERSGSLADGGGWYYQTLNGRNVPPGGTGSGLIGSEADQLRVTAFLFEDIGVTGLFSDWAATTALVDRCLAAVTISGPLGALVATD